jgi:hypothetical protein
VTVRGSNVPAPWKTNTYCRSPVSRTASAGTASLRPNGTSMFDVHERLRPQVAIRRRHENARPRGARLRIQHAVHRDDLRRVRTRVGRRRDDGYRLSGVHEVDLVLVDLGVDPDLLAGQQEILRIVIGRGHHLDDVLRHAHLPQSQHGRTSDLRRSSARCLPILDGGPVQVGVIRHLAGGPNDLRQVLRRNLCVRHSDQLLPLGRQGERRVTRHVAALSRLLVAVDRDVVHPHLVFPRRR